MKFTPPLRDDLAGVEPYGAPVIDVPARLNVNENPFPISAEISSAIGAAVERITPGLNRYPDREAMALRAALAAYLAHDAGQVLDVAQVWVANGSNEVMHQIFAAFGGPGRFALTFVPTYSMYPEYARETFTKVIEQPRLADFTIDMDAALAAMVEQRPTIVVVASPNNPTGTAVALGDLAILAEAALKIGAVFVVDEAYAEFRRTGVASALTLLRTFENVMVTRTMSKAFSMAGARVGYVAAQPCLIDALRIVRLPYHLSAITQAVAITALDFSDEMLAQVDLLRDERDQLALWLEDEGFAVAQSDANFICFGEVVDSAAIWLSLVEQGVLIRQTGPKGWLRVSIGTPTENAMFRGALRHAMKKGQP